MTTDEMTAYAKTIAEGGKINKAEVVTFMKALLAEVPPETESPALAAPAPVAPSAAEFVAPTWTAPFIRITAQGAVHVQVAQFFNKPEALQLGLAIVAAAKS